MAQTKAQRSAAAKKAAATRKRKAAKRSAAGKKGAQTRKRQAAKKPSVRAKKTARKAVRRAQGKKR